MMPSRKAVALAHADPDVTADVAPAATPNRLGKRQRHLDVEATFNASSENWYHWRQALQTLAIIDQRMRQDADTERNEGE